MLPRFAFASRVKVIPARTSRHRFIGGIPQEPMVQASSTSTPPRQAQPTRRRCPLCQSDAELAREIPGVASAPWLLLKCGRCGLVYLGNPPDYQTLAESFSWDQSYPQRKRERQEARRAPVRALRRGLTGVIRLIRAALRRDKLKRLGRKYLPEKGRVLDLGCDTGYNARALSPGLVPVGIEISEALAAKARSRFEPRGGEVVTDAVLPALRQLPAGSCVGAIAKSYLEHEIHPRPVLLELARVLQPGAAVIIKVPNHACWLRYLRGAQWCGYRFPDHVNYFTPRSLVRLLDETGFDIARMHLTDRLPTSDNMWCVARRRDGQPIQTDPAGEFNAAPA